MYYFRGKGYLLLSFYKLSSPCKNNRLLQSSLGKMSRKGNDRQSFGEYKYSLLHRASSVPVCTRE